MNAAIAFLVSVLGQTLYNRVVIRIVNHWCVLRVFANDIDPGICVRNPASCDGDNLCIPHDA